MTIPVLTTKLNCPRPLPAWRQRSHLIQRLDDGLMLGRKLALVSAPAGFGQTTVLSEWAAHLLASDESNSNEIAWLSLDERDNDPVRFLTYLISAIQTV